MQTPMKENLMEHDIKELPIMKHNLLASTDQTVYLNKPRDFKEPEPTPTPEPEKPVTQEVPKGPTEDSWEKRHNDTKSFLTKQLNDRDVQINELIQQVKSLQTAKEEIKLPMTEQEMATFADEYPGFAAAMETYVLKNNKDLTAKLNEELKEVKQKTQQIDKEKAWNKLKEIHPDIDDISNDPNFAEWYNNQSQFIKNLVNSPLVTDAAKGVDLYKADTNYGKTSKQRKEEALNASKSVATNSKVESGVTPKIWRASEIKGMRPAQYALISAEVDKAISEKRFINDA